MSEVRTRLPAAVEAASSYGDRISQRVGLDLRFVARTLSRSLLPLWFVVSSALTLHQFVDLHVLGIDAVLYREAAVRAISGGDPWAIQAGGARFAGPPPTLLFYMPAAIFPQSIAVPIVVIVGLVAAIWAIRRLELPLWWLLFPPLFEGIITGNPDALILALLLVRGPLAGLAAGLKVYAVVPLVLERRWTAVAVAVLVTSLSLPFVPAFLANLHVVAATLDEQTAGLSAWGTLAMIPTIVALVALRRRGAEWLVVPTLWPNTQRHYGAMSIPAVRRSSIGAALMSIGLPLAPTAAVIFMAIEATVRDRWRPAEPEAS